MNVANRTSNALRNKINLLFRATEHTPCASLRFASMTKTRETCVTSRI